MAYQSGSIDVGEDATLVCTVPADGVRLKNMGGVTVYVGDAGVAADEDSAGYPLDAGTSEDFPGVTVKETPVVPAPPRDAQQPQIYACIAKGTGPAQIHWISF